MFHKTIKVDLQICLQLLANNIVKSKVLYFHNYNIFSFQNHSNALSANNIVKLKVLLANNIIDQTIFFFWKNLMNNTEIHF